jgi:hypothetical protein
MPFCGFRVLVGEVCYRGPMPARRYQGSFDHPVRAFFIGMSLLMLLFGGFVVGIEAGTNPRRVADVQTITVNGKTLTLAADPQTITATELRDGKTKLVRVKGESFTRVVTVTKEGRTVVIGVVAPAKTVDGTVLPTDITPLQTPVTLPPTTVTVTLPLETTTVTTTEVVTTTVTSTVTDTGSGSSEPSETTP